MESVIKLSVKDRILMMQFLPQKGGLIEIRLSKDISDKVQFTMQEIEEFSLRDGENNSILSTNPKAFRDTEITLTNTQIKMLKTSIERMNLEQNITVDMLPLIDKIMAAEA